MVYEPGNENFLQIENYIICKSKQKDYFFGSNTVEGEEIFDNLEIKVAKEYLAELVKYYGATTGNLLEIGYGNGFFLYEAQKLGFDITSAEIRGFSGDKINQILETEKVKSGTFESVILPETEYDICVLFDIVEYVEEPLKFLERVRKLLKPQGVLFLKTTSLNNSNSKILKQNCMKSKFNRLYWFDFQSIQNILTKVGYKNIKIFSNFKHGRLEFINKQFKSVDSGMNILCRAEEIRDLKILSIIIPVYNEKYTIRQLINTVLQKSLPGIAKEIIIVESNSTDGTKEIVKEFENYQGVKLVLEDKPQGKGHAVRTGLKHATGDFILIQDGDLEYDINDYDQLLEPLVKYEQAFVLGSRHLGNWKMRKFVDRPVIAAVMNFGHIFFTGLINISCGSKLKDPFTMYKVFRRDCLYGLKLEANRFDFDWELIIKILRKGYVPKEISVNYISRSYSEGKKVSFLKDPILWIIALIKYRYLRDVYEFDENK